MVVTVVHFCCGLKCFREYTSDNSQAFLFDHHVKNMSIFRKENVTSNL